jgi:hypothetical protein
MACPRFTDVLAKLALLRDCANQARGVAASLHEAQRMLRTAHAQTWPALKSTPARGAELGPSVFGSLGRLRKQ